MSIFTNSSSSTAEEIKGYTGAVFGLLGDRDPLHVLRATESALTRSIEGLSDAQLGTPELPGKWSIRQVLRHLADSDLVWGWRLRMVLAHDRPPITGYDQDLWANRLHYSLADVKESLEQFGLLRRVNLRLLDHTTGDDQKRVGIHAERGEESVSYMTRLYAGHDLLHLRQIDRIRKAIES